MAKQFFIRLRNYYLKVAEVLRGEAEASSIFPNPSDIGISRERIYADFLRFHAPSKCNVFFGGFLFHEDGSESKQLDVIITTDTAPRFDFHNQDGGGKSFSPVEGTLGVASIKSTLDQTQLFDALDGFASIPPMQPLVNRASPLIKIPNYEDWPYKILYASNGIGADTLMQHLNKYYGDHLEISINRRPHVIQVAGKYAIFRVVKGMSVLSRLGKQVEQPQIGEFCLVTTDSDLQAISWVLNDLQKNASASSHILFTYDHLINKIH